ncbi:MAG: metalloregulator ArsR/SmtB family transcription factor [Clostridia bacterium]|nr:metalloregulator ArsR/SmtB family transcription factor [Clostridia bacterium]
MEGLYADLALLFKALSDETRLKIIDMLSCGELCACEILKSLNVTQPTLSYHMKILTECAVVNGRRDGAWMHYTLNSETVRHITEYWSGLTAGKENCVCCSCTHNECAPEPETPEESAPNEQGRS